MPFLKGFITNLLQPQSAQFGIAGPVGTGAAAGFGTSAFGVRGFMISARLMAGCLALAAVITAESFFSGSGGGAVSAAAVGSPSVATGTGGGISSA